MAASSLPLVAPVPRRADFQRWRRRSRLIRRLRVVLPGVIVLILAALGVTIAYNTLNGAAGLPQEAKTPIRLVNPRFVGRDDKGRAFVLTAATATRDDQDYQRVLLVHPALVLDEGGTDEVRVISKAGVYHEGTRKLEMSGGVRLTGSRTAFQTAESLFDTKSGELVGSGPIQGAGSLGEITAKSYGVYGKGDRMVFKGGVHTRLDKK